MTTTLDHRSPLALKPLAPAHPTTRTAGWERNGDRRDRIHLALSELFSQRADLDGVRLVADLLAEDLLWSV